MLDVKYFLVTKNSISEFDSLSKCVHKGLVFERLNITYVIYQLANGVSKRLYSYGSKNSLRVFII